jgi:hypothetical protein
VSPGFSLVLGTGLALLKSCFAVDSGISASLITQAPTAISLPSRRFVGTRVFSAEEAVSLVLLQVRRAVRGRMCDFCHWRRDRQAAVLSSTDMLSEFLSSNTFTWQDLSFGAAAVAIGPGADH